MDNKHLDCQLSPRNIRLVENQCENADHAQTVKENKVQNQRKKWRVVKGTNLVKEDHEPEKIDVVQIDNAHFYQKPGPRNNWVCEHADQARPGIEDKVQSQIISQQLVKGKNVVREYHEASRKAVIWIE
ncbi:hypothetical protein Pfo_021234 [Paulownia fortunei]|nr:hypothetical protein Pfo_021234 [Paulownia fortunei]